jgi:uroporphyrin-III C-methyltransferase/precorrin-2 dehydrogenase/sirohydrochlorin ferrochelatase
MGLLALETICTQLMIHGLPADTPAAVIQQGTTASQKVVTGTLANLYERVTATQLKAPTLIIVGGVVALRSKLNWFNPA